METEETKPKKRSRWKTIAYIVFPLLAAGALVWLLNRIGWERIGNTLATVGWKGVLILAALGFTECLFDSAALRAAMLKHIGLYRVLTYNSVGAIVNSIVPGEMGEVAKASLLRRHGTLQDAIAGTVLWNYIFKLSRPLVAFSAAATAWILGHGIENWVAAVVLLATLMAFLPFFLFRLLVKKGAAGLIVKLLRALRIIRKDPEKIVEAARELDSRIRDFKKNQPAEYWKVFGFQVAARVAGWITLFAAVRLVGLDFSFGLCSIIYAGFNVAALVITLLPARLGVNEGAGYLIFSLYKLDPAMGLIVYIILRLKTLVTNGIPAIFRT